MKELLLDPQFQQAVREYKAGYRVAYFVCDPKKADSLFDALAESVKDIKDIVINKDKRTLGIANEYAYFKIATAPSYDGMRYDK